MRVDSNLNYKRYWRQSFNVLRRKYFQTKEFLSVKLIDGSSSKSVCVFSTNGLFNVHNLVNI